MGKDAKDRRQKATSSSRTLWRRSGIRGLGAAPNSVGVVARGSVLDEIHTKSVRIRRAVRRPTHFVTRTRAAHWMALASTSSRLRQPPSVAKPASRPMSWQPIAGTGVSYRGPGGYAACSSQTYCTHGTGRGMGKKLGDCAVAMNCSPNCRRDRGIRTRVLSRQLGIAVGALSLDTQSS